MGCYRSLCSKLPNGNEQLLRQALEVCHDFWALDGIDYNRDMKSLTRSLVIVTLLVASCSCLAQLVQIGPGPDDPNYCANEPVKPNLHLQSGVVVKGRLSDRSGAWFANKKVEIRRLVSTTKQVVVANTTTDGEGRFDLGLIAKGDYRLVASSTRAFRQPSENWCKPNLPCVLNLVLDVNPRDQPYSQCAVR
jgi:hypothetical protein